MARVNVWDKGIDHFRTPRDFIGRKLRALAIGAVLLGGTFGIAPGAGIGLLASTLFSGEGKDFLPIRALEYVADLALMAAAFTLCVSTAGLAVPAIGFLGIAWGEIAGVAAALSVRGMAEAARGDPSVNARRAHHNHTIWMFKPTK